MALYQHSIRLGEKGTKILNFPLTRLVIAICFLVIGYSISYYLSAWIVGLFDDEPFKYFKETIDVVLVCSVGIFGYWIFVSLFDGKPMTDFGSGFLKQTGLGILLGFGFISLIMIVLSLLGYYRIDGKNAEAAVFLVFLMSVQAGIIEEIMLRGYFFRIVEEGVGTWWSVVLSALLFGFLHIWNPNASVISSLSIALTAGVVLALLYAITRKLWLVIGLHFAWNFTLGGLYGAPVSGTEARGFYKGVLDGPEWLTGGDFGPEASVLTMLVFSIFGVYLVLRTIREKQVKYPMWRKSK